MPPTIGDDQHRGRRAGRAGRWAALIVLAAVVLAVIAVVASTQLTTHGAAAPLTRPTLATHPPQPTRHCRAVFVPAFFSPGSEWTRVITSNPPPSTIILDITSTGAGSAPEPGFLDLVKRAQAAGIQVLGYASTDYGQRPASAVEADVRNYRAWYGVTDVFLDLAASGVRQLGYYQELASYIRTVDPGATLWLNTGVYPDERYMSVASVVMVFEGSYASYRDLRVPNWAFHYPAARFAHTIYATPASDLASAISLSGSRGAGHTYITDRSGANPYSGLPGYWSRENTAITSSCTDAASG
jgi:Spherulation-specific family 4